MSDDAPLSDRSSDDSDSTDPERTQGTPDAEAGPLGQSDTPDSGVGGAESDQDEQGDEVGGTGGDEAVDKGAADDVDPAVVEEIGAQLSGPDVQVLTTIRDVNSHPGNYPDTHTVRGECPATTTAVREATGLSKRQVDYRMSKGKRGLEEDDLGLLRIHESDWTPEGPSPKSAELTQLGERVLAVAMGEATPTVAGRSGGRGGIAGASDVEELREELAAVRERVAAIEGAEMGALDEETARKIQAVFDSMVMFYDLFEALGIDAAGIGGGAVPSERQEEIRQALADELAPAVLESAGLESAATQPAASEGLDDGASTPGDGSGDEGGQSPRATMQGEKPGGEESGGGEDGCESAATGSLSDYE